MQDENQSGCTIGTSRRAILKSVAGIAAASAMNKPLHGLAASLKPWRSVNPRWYGFNLLEYFSTDTDWMKYFPYRNDGAFKEDDFRWMRDSGFNWVRLPMDYRFWTDPQNIMKIDEKMIEPIDRAIKLGDRYGIHVNISLHRAPGECILDGMDEKMTGIHVTYEKSSVYDDRAALDAFVHQWTFFARRYTGISNDKLSFNLVNEPGARNNNADGERKYVRVARAAIDGIRAVDSTRLIVTDGYNIARSPIESLFDTGILQSAHDYSPMKVTHYRVEWVRSQDNVLWPVPNLAIEGRGR